jgi:hypothetical protein
MKALGLIIIILLLSCEKEKKCYYCIKSTLTTSSVPIAGFPIIEQGEPEIRCNETPAEIDSHEKRASYSERKTVSGITVTQKIILKCTLIE